MMTIVFVEVDGKHNGYQLSPHNFKRAPKGRIRIARFWTGFWPERGLGYYGDTYFREFIRKWKYKVITRRQRLLDKWHVVLLEKNTPLNMDMLSGVASFL
jgi:hypothetical protein